MANVMEGWLDIAFSQVVENTIAGAVLGSIFLLVVSLTRRALPTLSVSLAVLVLVRLAFPVAPEIGVGNLLQWKKAHEIDQDSYLAESVAPPQAEFEQLVLSDSFEGVTQEGSELAGEQFFAAERNVDYAILWRAIWLTGMLLLLSCVFVRQFRFAVRMRRRSQAVEGPISDLLKECCEELKICRRVRFEAMEGLHSPILFGLFGPRLLVPVGFEKSFSHDEVRAIFFHELAHLKRFDLWWNWFALLLACVHWFNPVVWLVIRRFRSDREFLCDRYAMQHLGHASLYPATLLKVVEGFTTRKNSMLRAAVASPMFRQKSEIKQRLFMIQNPRALSPLQLAVILPAFCGIALFTFPIAADEKDNDEARRGGDRPSPEHAEKRGGDRPGREAEGRKAPDRPSPEREVRRDGDRPSPEREGHRDGDREHPEREVRRDGDREHPEREMHRDSRLHHLRTAAENLERAGLHEDARRYHEQAERLQAEMIRRHIPEAQHHRAEQLEREVRELRAVVGHLQREIAELHEQLRRKRD